MHTRMFIKKIRRNYHEVTTYATAQISESLSFRHFEGTLLFFLDNILSELNLKTKRSRFDAFKCIRSTYIETVPHLFECFINTPMLKVSKQVYTFACMPREKSLAIYFGDSQFSRNRNFNFIISKIAYGKTHYN